VTGQTGSARASIYFAVGGASGVFDRMLKQQRLHCLVFVRFIQNKNRCHFAVPPHAVPGALALPGYDPEFGDRGLMPVFDRDDPTRALSAKVPDF
jgi:hypothetical protein